MAYGTAPSLNDAAVRAYLNHILHFYRRATASDEAVSDLKARLVAAGGSPLYAVTQRLNERLSQALGDEYVVFTGMKHSPPVLEDVVRDIAAAGFREAVGIPLAPFPSRLSTDGYVKAVDDANQRLSDAMRWRFIGEWYRNDRFLGLWEKLIREALAEHGASRHVVFTNHSLPVKIREWNDPYEAAFQGSAAALGDRLDTTWSTAFQSAGGGGQPWLGPSLEEVLPDLKAAGHRRFLVVPIGFLMDHLEIRYDLDIVARRQAVELEIDLVRTRMPNDDPDLVELLAEQVKRKE